MGGAHSHLPPRTSRAFAWVFALNLGFAIVQLFGSWWSSSHAVFASALHDLGDAAAVGIAWGLELRSHNRPDFAYSYGYRRYSTFGALLVGALVLASCLSITGLSIWNGFHRTYLPDLSGMLGLGLLGVLVNAIAFFVMHKHKGLHEQLMSWHFLEDVLSWVAVLLGALVMWMTSWAWIDSLLAVCLSLFVAYRILQPLKRTLRVFLQAAPSPEIMEKIRTHLMGITGVHSVHHLHVWSLDGTHHVLTTHLVVSGNPQLSELVALKTKIKTLLRNDHSVLEATLEFESENGEACFDPDHPKHD